MAFAVSGSAFAQDEGKELFQSGCAQCHALEEGDNQVGPHLVGIIGRQAGAAEGFSYSQALQQSGVTWTPEVIDSFIANPQAFIPGNSMLHAGLSDPAQRQAIIAFLEQSAGTVGEGTSP